MRHKMKILLVLFAISTTLLDQSLAQQYPYTKFPDNFLFGAATASHQIEGAWNLSGKTENIWDHLAHFRPRWVVDGTNGDIAVDSYHRYAEDVDELSFLGVDFYRMSLSWARILPTGRADKINQEGVDYYNRLFNLLLQKNIKPYVTLYHWDLPKTLQDLGGWANPYMMEYFEDYSRVCFQLFGDRVKNWITFNEPQALCDEGYGNINSAPAINSHGVGTYLCGDTLLKAHALSYHLYNTTFRPTQNGLITISIDSVFYAPKNKNNAKDVALADVANQFKFGWFAHPIFSKEGCYPRIMVEQVGNRSREEGLLRSRLPVMSEEWRQKILGTADLLAINHYTTRVVTPGLDPTAQSPSWLKDVGAVVSLDIGKPSTSHWLRVYPQGFGDMLRWVQKQYNNPEVIITENGVSDRGSLNDDFRISYFNDYLAEILKCIYDDKMNITGYTAWSLMDSFEWRSGFSQRSVLDCFPSTFLTQLYPGRPKNLLLCIKTFCLQGNCLTMALPSILQFNNSKLWKEKNLNNVEYK